MYTYVCVAIGRTSARGTLRFWSAPRERIPLVQRPVVRGTEHRGHAPRSESRTHTPRCQCDEQKCGSQFRVIGVGGERCDADRRAPLTPSMTACQILSPTCPNRCSRGTRNCHQARGGCDRQVCPCVCVCMCVCVCVCVFAVKGACLWIMFGGMSEALVSNL